MSTIRRVRININPEVFEELAQIKGWKIDRYSIPKFCRDVCDVVIGGIVGFKETEAVYDSMYTDNYMYYMEQYIRHVLNMKGYMVVNRKVERDKIVLEVS